MARLLRRLPATTAVRAKCARSRRQRALQCSGEGGEKPTSLAIPGSAPDEPSVIAFSHRPRGLGSLNLQTRQDAILLLPEADGFPNPNPM